MSRHHLDFNKFSNEEILICVMSFVSMETLSESHDGSDKVTVTLDGLSVSLLMASVFYLFCVFIVKRKLSKLHKDNPEFGTKKLLVISVGLVCIIRLMSFIGVAALNIANVKAHYSSNSDLLYSSPKMSEKQRMFKSLLSPMKNDDTKPFSLVSIQDRNQYFYDKSMTVLFDLPNCIVVSTYVLLTLVWTECFLYSRFHTKDTLKWRTRWLAIYMVFNTGLYSTQMMCYILVLIPATSNFATPFLYVAMTCINFAAPFMVLVLYIILGVKFSGYPFRSMHSKNDMKKISVTIAVWSITRIIWGVAMMNIYRNHIHLIENDLDSYSYFKLFLLFLICEILPILIMLDYSYDAIFEFENRASKEMRMLASGEQIVSFFKKGKGHKHKNALIGNIDVDIDDDGSESLDDSVSSLSKFNWKDNQRSLYGEVENMDYQKM